MASGGSEAAERLRLRYPPSRLPKPVLVVAVSLVAVVALTWLVWTANLHAHPAVSAQVTGYRVLSDRSISVTVTVDRPDPSRAVTCQVVAQAPDFTTVGSLDRLTVGARAEKVVNVTQTIQTLRRATSASVRSCSLV